MGYYKVIRLKKPKLPKISVIINGMSKKPKKFYERKRQKIKKFLWGALILIAAISVVRIGVILKHRNETAIVNSQLTENKMSAKNIFLTETLPLLDKKGGNIITESSQESLLDEKVSAYFTFDDNALIMPEDFDLSSFQNEPIAVDLYGQEPKILVVHTHSQEEYIDSREGMEEDTIVGVGQTLCEILANEYGISVVHDVKQYDMENGELNRENSYEKMEQSVLKLLKKYPSVKVILDLHRDGVADDVHLVTTIEGQPTARLMFVNGICRPIEKAENVKNFNNPYIKENLAFSYQMQLQAETIYPDFMRKIYIKPYRYSTNLMPYSLLVEVGANTNTVEEAKNAMAPFAKLLTAVLGD